MNEMGFLDRIPGLSGTRERFRRVSGAGGPIVTTLLFVCCAQALAQGEDSQVYERDLQVITSLLAGGFDNANQAYFDRRGDRTVKHRRLHIDVNPVDAPEIGDHAFVASMYWDNDPDGETGDQLWVLSGDAQTGRVHMRAYALERSVQAERMLGRKALNDKASCDFYWRREAAQFRAVADERCESSLPAEIVLSTRQLWVEYPGNEGNDYQLHRVRDFECYADIPGVGGGRDIPYDRYDGFRTHDQGGQIWFTSREGRRLGISLLLVDWPINNYEGVFTRDSFVIYVSEETGEGQKEHGYAFTVPEADRIGINLKWMLASCFMKSNRFETPYM